MHPILSSARRHAKAPAAGMPKEVHGIWQDTQGGHSGCKPQGAAWLPRRGDWKLWSSQLQDCAMTVVSKAELSELRKRLRRSQAELERLRKENQKIGSVLSQLGGPALHIAAAADGNVSVVKALLDAGADVDQRDSSGNTALLANVRDENLAVVKELVARGAEVNTVNHEGDTPLTNAATWGSERVVRFLLSNGADPTQADGKGVTADILALQQGHKRIAQLIQNAADKAPRH